MRKEGKNTKKNKIIALILDCIYYAWQNEKITDKEFWELENIICKIIKIIKYLEK